MSKINQRAGFTVSSTQTVVGDPRDAVVVHRSSCHDKHMEDLMALKLRVGKRELTQFREHRKRHKRGFGDIPRCHNNQGSSVPERGERKVRRQRCRELPLL